MPADTPSFPTPGTAKAAEFGAKADPLDGSSPKPWRQNVNMILDAENQTVCYLSGPRDANAALILWGVNNRDRLVADGLMLMEVKQGLRDAVTALRAEPFAADDRARIAGDIEALLGEGTEGGAA